MLSGIVVLKGKPDPCTIKPVKVTSVCHALNLTIHRYSDDRNQKDANQNNSKESSFLFELKLKQGKLT